MKLEEFQAGHWQARYQYKSFEPTPINQGWTWEDPLHQCLAGKGQSRLGRVKRLLADRAGYRFVYSNAHG